MTLIYIYIIALYFLFLFTGYGTGQRYWRHWRRRLDAGESTRQIAKRSSSQSQEVEVIFHRGARLFVVLFISAFWSQPFWVFHHSLLPCKSYIFAFVHVSFPLIKVFFSKYNWLNSMWRIGKKTDKIPSLCKHPNYCFVLPRKQIPYICLMIKIFLKLIFSVVFFRVFFENNMS